MVNEIGLLKRKAAPEISPEAVIENAGYIGYISLLGSSFMTLAGSMIFGAALAYLWLLWQDA
jgi:hypothetical protein